MATSHGNNRLLESETKPHSIIAPQPFPYARTPGQSAIITKPLMKVRVVWKSGSLLGRSPVDEADAPPQARIDICFHILGGFDDGPVDLDQSLAMLKQAAEHGTTEIVAIPRATFASALPPPDPTTLTAGDQTH